MITCGIVEIDIHQMTQIQAQTAIDAKLKRSDSGVYRIRVIHGYNRGTALRDMVRSRYRNDPKVKRIEIGMNQGVTDLVLRELF